MYKYVLRNGENGVRRGSPHSSGQQRQPISAGSLGIRGQTVKADKRLLQCLSRHSSLKVRGSFLFFFFFSSLHFFSPPRPPYILKFSNHG